MSPPIVRSDVFAADDRVPQLCTDASHGQLHGPVSLALRGIDFHYHFVAGFRCAHGILRAMAGWQVV